jgi:signal transduction histidine kinase
VRLSSRWLIGFGCVGIILLGWLIWAMGHTEPPGFVGVVTLMATVMLLAVGPWAVLAGRKSGRDDPAGRLVLRAVRVAALMALVGTTIAVAADDSTIAMASIFFAGVFALIGGVVVPWMYLLARTLTRERAGRVRAEERAGVAAHLHDSVLQALTLIQKRSEDAVAVRRLARGTERELRAWLYGAPGSGDDFAGAVRAATEQIEDRYGVMVELVLVGTCPLDHRGHALVGAVREALTNAAKHSGEKRVSLFAEVEDVEILVLVRDRGRGFDPAVGGELGRRGIADSIEARMLGQGGIATITSTVGEGTEVELRMPLVLGR